MLELVDEIFTEFRFPFDASNFPRTTATQTAYCNYWLGTTAFWEKYWEFLEPIYAFMTDKSRIERYSRLTDYRLPVGYIPFIIERLFSTYLILNSQTKTMIFPYSREDIWKRTWALWQHQVMNLTFESTNVMDQIAEFPEGLKRDYFFWINKIGQFFRSYTPSKQEEYDAFQWLFKR